MLPVGEEIDECEVADARGVRDERTMNEEMLW